MGTAGNRLVSFIAFFLLLVPAVSIAQKPFIHKISPNNSQTNNLVSISGLNFSGSPMVFFGGMEATVTSNTNNLIQAVIPAGAANASIFVLNNGEIAQSSEKFFVSYAGSSISAHEDEFIVSTALPSASDLCLCDLNADSKNDLVMINNHDDGQDLAEAIIFLNNLSSDAALSGSDFQISQSLNLSNHSDGFSSVVCGDFDNDGFNDLAFTSVLGTDASDVLVIRNPGTGVFPSIATIEKVLPTTSTNDQRQPGSIVSADLDQDGRLDLVVGNNFKDGTFHIFRNTSSSGSIGFADAFEITTGIEESAGVLISTGILSLADLNNDGNQDIISSAFRETNAEIHLFRNQSIQGEFNFEYDGSVSNGGQVSDIESGDLDNDGDLEIIVASNLTGRVTFFENQSGDEISFTAGSNLTTSAQFDTGIGLSDMNGDGTLDVVTSNATGGIFILPNTSTNTISFGEEQIQNTAGATTGFLVAGDLNSDGKPDIAYSRAINQDPSSLGIIINRNCIIPEIFPSEIEYCLGDSFTLSTFNSANATYNWEVLTGNGTVTSNGNKDAEITITSGSNATIRLTITQNGCSETQSVNLTVAGGTVPSIPSINLTSAGTLCTGDAVTISSSITSDNYFWTLPDGSESNASTIQLNPISVENAGKYTLRIQDTGGCSSETVSRTLEVSSPPSLTVFNTGLANFCEEVTLQVPDFSADGITYQWKENGSNLGSSDQNSASITVSQSGVYTVEGTNIENCTTVSSSLQLNKIDLPISIIDGPTETCQDFPTTFLAGSTGESGFTLEYDWTIRDASNAVIQSGNSTSIEQTFTQTGNYTITLNTSYNSNEVYPGPNANDLCVNTTELNLVVSAPPTIEFSVSDLTPKCQDESLTVNLLSPVANEIANYAWAIKSGNSILNLSDETEISVETPIGTDTVYLVIDVITDIGCEVRDSIRIRNFITEADIVSPDFPTIQSVDSTTLEDAISITLSAENITSDIAWEPAELIDNPNASTIQYFPQNPTSNVILSGIDIDGCAVSTQVTIYLDNIRPKKTFSPNGDGTNDCWEILNIGDIGEANGCEVFIFDARGRNVTNVINAFNNENCVWDGTSSGTNVPEGIYYYVLKCETEEFSKSGSILLAR